jgi:hypothetical protein
MRWLASYKLLQLNGEPTQRTIVQFNVRQTNQRNERRLETMKKEMNVTAGTVTFTFEGLAPIIFEAAKASPEMEAHALLHGWMARIGDSAAISRKQKDGTVITVTEEMRRAEIEAMVKHYESGTTQWEMRSGVRAPAQNPTILAIAAKRGCTYAEAEAFLAAQFLETME